MIVTEEQARTKQCASNCTNYCVASKCMAWRVDSAAGEFPMRVAEAKVLVERDSNFVIVSEAESTLRPNATVRRLADVGYCGLAGQVSP